MCINQQTEASVLTQ